MVFGELGEFHGVGELGENGISRIFFHEFRPTLIYCIEQGCCHVHLGENSFYVLCYILRLRI